MKLNNAIKATLFGLSWLPMVGLAQEAKEEVIQLEEMAVVATGSELATFDTPYSVETITSDEIKMQLQSPDWMYAIDTIPGVMLQKTGRGLHSPYMRGVTSQRTVLMVDGVKLNNSFLREGPNEYWTLTDPFFFDTVEVMLGPSSVLYGSDAIGGAINLVTHLDRGVEGAGWQHLNGEVYLRGATGENSISTHIKEQFAYGDKLTLKMGLTRQDFGELVSGDHTHNEFTNFEQWSANVRGRYWFDNDHRIFFGFDNFDKDNVDRTQKTVYYQPWQGTQPGSDLRRIYDYDRRNVFGRYEVRNGKGFINEMDLGLSYNFLQENYHRIRPDFSNEKTQTKVETLGLNLRLQTLSDFGTWSYGMDYAGDRVHADKTRDGKPPYDQGLVADNAYYHQYGIYLQNQYKINEKWETIIGARQSWFRMDARDTNLDGVNDGVTDDLKGNWDAFTLSGRVIYHALDNNRLNFFGGVSQGFRAPNLSDATRDGDYGGGTEAPTADLDAEKFTTFELGMKTRGEWGRAHVTTFYTEIEDRIARLKNPTATKRNTDEGKVYGIEAGIDYNLNADWLAFGSIAWQYGSEDNWYDRDVTKPGNTLPLSRILPLTGRVGLRYAPNLSRYWVETSLDMAGEQDRLTDAEKTDNRFPNNGTPGYCIMNVRGGYRFNESTDLTLGVENIGDVAYRTHGSGVNEVGRNVVLSLRHTF